jgi:hypothetical protein
MTKPSNMPAHHSLTTTTITIDAASSLLSSPLYHQHQCVHICHHRFHALSTITATFEGADWMDSGPKQQWTTVVWAIDKFFFFFFFVFIN